MEQLLMDVSDYSPVLPDSVTQLLLSRAGLDTESDPRVARIAALAAQKVSPSITWRRIEKERTRHVLVHVASVAAVFDILVLVYLGYIAGRIPMREKSTKQRENSNQELFHKREFCQLVRDYRDRAGPILIFDHPRPTGHLAGQNFLVCKTGWK